MDTRCLMLLTLWLTFTLGGAALIAGLGLRDQLTAAWVLIPWLFATAVAFIGVFIAPEEV